MMKLHEAAKDVGVSDEELIEILQDIDITVDGPDAELTDEQVAQVCDELGYDSIEAARAENVPAEEPEPPAEEPPPEDAPSAAPEAEAPTAAAPEAEALPEEEPPADDSSCPDCSRASVPSNVSEALMSSSRTPR